MFINNKADKSRRDYSRGHHAPVDYSLNMLKLLQDMNLVTEDEVTKIKKSLSEHYGVTDIYYS